MPCLNEAETLEICILKAQAFLDRAGISGEILIGDNGSTDGSQDIARRCGARVVDVGVKGYGAAIYGAVMEARGRYCIMGDSDDSYDFCRLELFVEKLRGGTDLVMGNRFLGGIAPEAMPWQNRYIGNPILSGIGRLLFRCPVRDFHCGLRGFSREAFLQMRLRTVGMEFASEMIIKATILNMKIAEVPTTLAPDGRSRPPHLRPYRDGWRHLRFMLLFSPNWLLLYPGLMLMLAGVALGVTLVVHPIRIGSVRLSIDTLIYCASMIEMGFQSVLFALLSRSYAAQEGLIPRSRQTAWVDRIVSLERGLVLGIVLIVAGLLMLTHALTAWSNTGFGNLDVEQVTRTVVGSSLCLCLGFEVILSSLLLSTFRLSLRGTT
ncbi:MAG: dolichol-P-glucose synthetase [Acidocella sp. 20-61-6]|nr:MAG: dolichol-P-glucose synthetase [Acidocella sp. 20-61-6]